MRISMTQSSVLFLKPWRMLFSINGRKVSGGTSACAGILYFILNLQFILESGLFNAHIRSYMPQFILKRGLLGSCGGQILADVVR